MNVSSEMNAYGLYKLALKKALKMETCHDEQECKEEEVQRLNWKSVATFFIFFLLKEQAAVLNLLKERKDMLHQT